MCFHKDIMFRQLTQFSKQRILVPVKVRNINTRLSIDINYALWDTGAVQTVISKDIAKCLQLKPTSIGKVDTANGTVRSWTVSCEFELPDGGVFEIENVIVPDNNLKGHVVLGMDIMSFGISQIKTINIDNQKYIELLFEINKMAIKG